MINNLRYRFESSSLQLLGTESSLLSSLIIFKYNPNEDLKNLIYLKLIPQKEKLKQLNYESETSMKPLVIIIDFNDKEILNTDFNSRGKIISITNSSIQTEYNTETKKIKYTIDRLINVFSIEITDKSENKTLSLEGVYELIEDIDKARIF